MLSSVGKHFLKSLSVIVSTCHGTVDIFVYDGISLRCRVLMPFGELSFYGLLCLSVGRVAGINDGVCRGIRLFVRLSLRILSLSAPFYFVPEALPALPRTAFLILVPVQQTAGVDHNFFEVRAVEPRKHSSNILWQRRVALLIYRVIRIIIGAAQQIIRRRLEQIRCVAHDFDIRLCTFFSSTRR